MLQGLLRGLLAMAAVALVCLPLVSGQSASDWDDSAGDAMIAGSGQSAPAGPSWDDVDITRGWVTEHQDNLSFGLTLSSWERPPQRTLARQIDMGFAFGGQEYVLAVMEPPCADSAALRIFNEGSGRFEDVTCLAVSNEGNDVEVSVPKSLLKDARGLPARPGVLVDGMHVLVSQPLTSGVLIVQDPSDASVSDRAPNRAFADPIMLSSWTDASTLVMSSPAPVRFTNGASAAIAYQVVLENPTTEPVELAMAVGDLPDGWTYRVSPRLKVPANDELSVPVIITMPFGHKHGELMTFNLTASNIADGSETQLPLGVLWPVVPQPAGHHNTLYLHSNRQDTTAVDTDFTLWANTVDEIADDVDVPPDSVRDPSAVTAEHLWHFPLEPQLFMGLDFDTSRPAHWEGTMIPAVPDDGAQAVAKIMYCDPDATDGVDAGRWSCTRGSWREVSQATQAVAASQGQAVQLGFDLAIPDELQILEFKPDSNIMMQLEFHTMDAVTGGITGLQPLLVTDSQRIQLPLKEYVDPIDEALASLGDLNVNLDGPMEREVNPGDRVNFQILVENTGGRPLNLKFSIEGTNSNWASWTKDSARLGSGDQVAAILSVAADPNAVEGDFADLYGVVEDSSGSGAIALMHVRVFVTESREIPSEDQPAVAKGAPGVALPLLGVALLGAAWRRR